SRVSRATVTPRANGHRCYRTAWEARMNKSQLVEEIARKTKLPTAEVAKVVEEFIAAVSRSVIRGEKVVLSGFGTFQRRARAKRVARDIWADEPLVVKATNVPSFKAGKPFRDAVARRRGVVGRSRRS